MSDDTNKVVSGNHIEKMSYDADLILRRRRALHQQAQQNSEINSTK